MPARLTIHFPSQPTSTVYVESDSTCLLGRGEDCDVVLPDDRVSRRHARLTATGEEWTLEDLDSKNGTTVDGRRAETLSLSGDHWVGLGGLLCHFELVSEEARQRAAEERMSRWHTTVQLQRRLDPSLGLPALLDRMVRSVLDLTQAERGFVLLPNATGDLEIMAHAGLEFSDLRQPEFSGSVGAVERVLESGQPVVSADIVLEEELGNRPSVVRGRIRALVCMPLVAGELAGVIYADSRQPGRGFDTLDLEILGAFAAQAAMAASIALLDRELASLAESLPTRRGIDAVAAAELAREIGRLTPAPPSRRVQDPAVVGSTTRWNDLVTHHRR